MRVGLNPPAPETRPPGAADVTAGKTALGPGEHLLHTIAGRLLAAAWPARQDMLPPSASTPEALTWLAGGVGDVVAALQACGAVSLLSPVPGQLATLCAGLNLSGHGITAPPASDLLAHRYQRRKTGTASERHRCAAAAVMLPDLDGIRLAILGLHNYRDNTVVHLHASGPMCDAIHGPAKPVINGQRLIEYASQSIRVNAVSPA